MTRLNRKKLEEMREAFDTMKLLSAEDALDALQARLCPCPAEEAEADELNAPGQLRKELHTLYDRTKELLETADPTDKDGAKVWELAWDLEMELSDYADKLHGLANLIEQLGELGVEDEETEGAEP